MKNRFKVVAILLVILMMSSGAFAEPVKVMVENNYLELSIDPLIEDGRTLVPLRAIFEAMGLSVRWQESTKTITASHDDQIIILQLNNKIASVNGKKVELDVAARAINGNTLVPVRFIAESLGAEVGWDQESKTVLVNSTIVKSKKTQEKKLEASKTQVTKTQENTKQQVKSTGKYVGSIDSDKYHNPTCRWAKKIKKNNEIWFDSISEAQEKGYKACGTCKAK